MRFFTGRLGVIFLGPFARLQYAGSTAKIPSNQIRHELEPDLSIQLTAADGVYSCLRKLSPDLEIARGEIHDVLFIPGAAVDHCIFASSWMKINAIEYFTSKDTAAGAYRVDSAEPIL